MAHGDAREGKWRGNWRMEWVASTLYTTSEHGVSSITTADAHTSAASSRLNLRPRLFKWTRPFRRKTKSDFCAFAITFQMASTTVCDTTSSFCELHCCTHRWKKYTKFFCMKTRGGMKVGLPLTLTFGTTRTAEVSALRAGRTLPPGEIPWYSVLWEAEWTPEWTGHLKIFQGPYRESNPEPPVFCRSSSTNCASRLQFYSSCINSVFSHHQRTWLFI
jgi:hypothetical protein